MIRGPLALTLLMLRIGTNDHLAAFALDDFALLANGFHGRFYLHDVNLLYNTRRLFRTPGDPGFGQVVGRHFHGDLVAKAMCANVDMYSGFVYSMLGIPEDLYTPMFAVSRMAGWCAHRFEELVTGKRIIRPAYKAISGEKKYIPLDER